ncbi:sensor histidine kinase [Cohnella lubricantis]|uniref:histidine kinase n=1 Tax=Cohnella lubricantis TaxID=2163172 RepID=A0A841TEM1_9BACL|nr:sensor histidine kinase [Cohnella lubricantis]MBB6678515.1 histidine kinase [Cohnella lubricantis]MBP2118438.1 two-component system sensor histidine kinase YesM [Cohnella lubricantis]
MFYSLRSRLITFFVLLFVLSFGALSILIFNESRSIIRSYIESSALEKMDEYGSYVDMVQTQIYDLASLVFNSEQTDEWDAAISDPTLTDGEKMLAHIKMSGYLTQTVNSYSSVSSAAIYRTDGTWISMYDQVVHDESITGQLWYKRFREENVRWMSAHIDEVEQRIHNNHHPVVSMLMPLSTFEPSTTRYILKVNVSADYFLKPLNRIHLGDSGSIYLLDQDGSPLLSPDEYGAVAADAGSEVTAKLDDWHKQGVAYFKNGQDEMQILVFKKVGVTNWMLVGLVPERDLYANLFSLRNSIIALAALLLLVSLLIAFWLSLGITKPLSRLVSAMRHVQRGDFASAESRLPPARIVRNEVGFATATFRNMIGRLRQHIQNEFELKLLRQQAEYKALLMQINPHFLFNTLELLSSLAMQRRTDDTVRVIESLGKMLRFSLKISDDLVELREELRYVRDYAAILQVRFGGRLRLGLEEEGDLEDVVIVKFILQPIIENAVKYSLKQQEEARVDVRVRRRDGRLHLSVADNGPGMPEELARQLRNPAAANHPHRVLASREGQIGLGNVIARCRLYYGSRFELRLDSLPGEGTHIELILPAQEVTAKCTEC